VRERQPITDLEEPQADERLFCVQLSRAADLSDEEILAFSSVAEVGEPQFERL
jgi:hypothetical protein